MKWLFVLIFACRSGRFLPGIISFEMCLKSPAESVGLCSIYQKLMSPFRYLLEIATTFLIKLRLNQAKGSSARFAFGRPGFCNELGDVFTFSGEWAKILIPWQCLKQSIHGASGGQMSRQAAAERQGREIIGGKGKKKPTIKVNWFTMWS